jgi:hypothetical protein
MIKVFIPQDKTQGKTNVRGFWYSKDNHKIYYDYLKIVSKTQFCFNSLYLNKIKQEYKQEALFLIDQDNTAYIYIYSIETAEHLTHRIYKEVLKGNLKIEIKEALKIYGGVTIYKEGNKYFKEIFYK